SAGSMVIIDREKSPPMLGFLERGKLGPTCCFPLAERAEVDLPRAQPRRIFMRHAVILAFIAMCSFALGQGTIFVPDNLSTAGVCNAIPLSASFGAGASTYLGRIPASYMDPVNRRIDDIAFAPCNGGTFAAPNLQMGMGHVPTPLPLPFVFPTFDGAGN